VKMNPVVFAMFSGGARRQRKSSVAARTPHKEPQSKRIRWQKSNDVVLANSCFPYSTVQCSRHQHANRCAECDPFSYVVGCGPDRRSYCHANSNSDVHYHTAPSLPTIFVTSTT
jgi:hypothetical protein